MFYPLKESYMLHFYLNNKRVDVTDISPTTTLLNYLRENLHLTGTKEGCAEGDCGACTVSIADIDHKGTRQYRAINSCLLLVASLNGKHIYTVEGLSSGTHLHPVQSAMVEKLGSQCGFCTPGIIMSMFSACYRKDMNEEWQLDDQMCGNLCRCTGYRPIREAAVKTAGLCPTDEFQKQLDDYEPKKVAISFKKGQRKFFMPISFKELWSIISKNPVHRFVSGATDLGLDITKRHCEYECLISLEGLVQLKRIDSMPSGWRIGAFVPLSDIELEFQDTLPTLSQMLRYFGARQIKNRATLGGNLCNASPIGDTPPALMSLEAVVVLMSSHGERRLPLSKFFRSYRKTVLEPGEILAYVEVPHANSDAYYGSYKVSKRRELDISAVAAGMRIETDSRNKIIDVCLAYGGMAATPKRAVRTEAALIGKPWTMETVDSVKHMLEIDFRPMDDQRGSAWFRQRLATNLLIGFYEESSLEMTSEFGFEKLPRKHAGTVTVSGGE